MFRSAPARCLFVGTMVLASAGTLRANWPEFRGPSGQGHSPSAQVPLSWSPEENVRWKTELPGQGWSSPVVQAGRIYLTAAVPQSPRGDLSLRLMELDGGSGAVAWSVEVFRQDPETAPAIHSKNSHASPTPVIEGDRIYVHFGHQGTACYDLSGQPIWKNATIVYDPQHGNGGSPILAGEHLIFSCDGAADPFVVALHKQSGKEAWRTPRTTDASKTFSFSTPLRIDVAGQPQVISPGSNCVMALDPETGQEIWRVRYEGYSVVARPVYDHGLVFISTSFNSPLAMAIRPDGRGDVTDSHVEWTMRRGVPNTPSFLLVDDLLFMVSDRGVASCLDARTGELHWQQRLGGAYSASPLHAAGRVYFQSEEGQTVVVAAAAEYRELARSDLGERTLASPAVIEDDLLIRTEVGLYRLRDASPMP